MRKLMPTIFIAAALAVAIPLGAGAQTGSEKDDDALRSHPGYVDFSTLDKIGQEAKVEVNLRNPMLGLVGKFISEEDPELRELISNLKLLRVRVYNVTPESIEKLLAAGSETSKMLDKKGWERIVRVRDENEHVDVYFKPSKNADFLEGVLVIALDDDDEAAFVNIVGTIRPEDVAKLGEHFDVDGMDKIKIQTKPHN